jgi:predicted Zn-ribbon and HTH transcriptional regulator
MKKSVNESNPMATPTRHLTSCEARRHASYEAAMTARWAMAQRRVDSDKLRPEKCTECGGWHLRRIPTEPITQRNNSYFECQDCGHEWLAPRADRCPHCFSQALENRGHKRSEYLRV